MTTNISFNSSFLDSFIFSSNYRPRYSNVASLSEAQVIVLPENYYIANDHMRNAWIINRLYREGDVVLVESPNDESETFHQIDQVCRRISVRGWDCPESDRALHEAKEPFYALRGRLFHLDGFGIEHRQILCEAIESGPCRTDESFKRHFRFILNNCNFLSPNLKKAFLLRKIQVWHEQNGELGRVLASTFSQRQGHLIRRCQEFSRLNNRVFITAGAAHALSIYEEQSFQDGVDLFHDYLREKKFVIFDYNRRPTRLLQADIKISLMMSSVEKTTTKICGCMSKFFFFLLIIFTFPVSLPCYLLYARNR